MKKIFLLLALVTTMIACQTEKEPYSPVAPNDDNNKQETTESKPDSTDDVVLGFYPDKKFYVAVVNEKGEDLIASNFIRVPTINVFNIIDGKKVLYDHSQYVNHRCGYMYEPATSTSYGTLIFVHSYPEKISQDVAGQFSEVTSYIHFGKEEQKIECTYWIYESLSYTLVKLVVNGKVEYDVTDPQNPMVNNELEKLVPNQNRGYVKVIRQ